MRHLPPKETKPTRNSVNLSPDSQKQAVPPLRQPSLGAGATGAGTTNTRPGIIAQFHLADALFLPKVAEKTAWARGYAANATMNQQLLTAASAYFDLVDAHQDLRIVEQSRGRFAELTEVTVNFAEAGQGLTADTWEVRNLGFGEKAVRRERSAQVQQARFEKLRVMDQVAREVSEAHSQVEFRARQIDITLGAIQNAEDSYRRNLERIRDGEGLPLEVLQSAQSLEAAQRAYLRAVVDYNQAQIRLQWALGFPVAECLSSREGISTLRRVGGKEI